MLYAFMYLIFLEFYVNKYVFFRISAKAEAQNISEKWHVSYHGTHPSVIRKILDGADLLLAGEDLLTVPYFWTYPDESYDLACQIGLRQLVIFSLFLILK